MKTLTIPTEIRTAIAAGATLAVSISGGKDSQALLKAIVEWYRSEGLTNKLFAIHADLGRTEWKQTPAFVEKLCLELGVELVIVRREREGKVVDLLAHWKARQEKLKGTGKPFWSSSKMRYCTSDLKREPINRYLRQFNNVVSIEGICWHESPARALKPRVKVREEITTKKRTALTWNAIIDWSLQDVWNSYGMSTELHCRAFEQYTETGQVPEWWSFHPAYAMGNTRLSCSMCILSNTSDFINGILHNAELADEISAMEEGSGFTFKQGASVAQVRAKYKQSEHRTAIRIALKLAHAKSIEYQPQMF